MILDTSAVVSIVLSEPQADALVKRIAEVAAVGIGTPTLCECAIVLASRLGPDRAQVKLAQFLQTFDVIEIPFREDHWRAAEKAFGRFGKGRDPAGLNFGDCMSYAVAKLANAPLLYIGNDFSKTDLA